MWMTGGGGRFPRLDRALKTAMAAIFIVSLVSIPLRGQGVLSHWMKRMRWGAVNREVNYHKAGWIIKRYKRAGRPLVLVSLTNTPFTQSCYFAIHRIPQGYFRVGQGEAFDFLTSASRPTDILLMDETGSSPEAREVLEYIKGTRDVMYADTIGRSNVYHYEID